MLFSSRQLLARVRSWPIAVIPETWQAAVHSDPSIASGFHGFGADLEWSAVELSRMHFINLSVVCSLEPFGRSEWIQLWRSASF